MADNGTTKTKATPPKAEKARPSKKDKAQAALDVLNRKVANVDKRLTRAKAEVTELETEKRDLLAERDYAANHPALAPTEPVADPSAPGGPGTEV